MLIGNNLIATPWLQVRVMSTERRFDLLLQIQIPRGKVVYAKAKQSNWWLLFYSLFMCQDEDENLSSSLELFALKQTCDERTNISM